ncbi:hypothetical protein RHMOL_Rhmol02G0188400 [Rhododendron molle]|uniref:Uncharacterized protein n=1 Tax=Rhododendron molle TaxID=49168 RepID=A0ACC0PT36_RHOML|nr:hypothetical protein RHMOL_Rhmol02G0188400 [Rhododendron molle]
MHRARCYKDIGACFKCGEVGHLIRDCTKKSRPRSTSKPTVTTNSRQSSGTKLDPGKRIVFY